MPVEEREEVAPASGPEYAGIRMVAEKPADVIPHLLWLLGQGEVEVDLPPPGAFGQVYVLKFVDAEENVLLAIKIRQTPQPLVLR